MPALRVGLIAGAVAAFLWLMLDSGRVSPEPAPAAASASLGVFALIFGAGAWVMSIAGQRERAPLLAGLAIATGGYAIFRLIAF
jgi:hypothetical protein